MHITHFHCVLDCDHPMASELLQMQRLNIIRYFAACNLTSSEYTLDSVAQKPILALRHPEIPPGRPTDHDTIVVYDSTARLVFGGRRRQSWTAYLPAYDMVDHLS
jgi:hypothetical protein